MARKGLEKFFDFGLHWIDPSAPTSDHHTKEDDKALRNVILGPVEDSFNKGEQVTLLKTNKANGECAQVSYNFMVKAWIVSSKNVAIAVRTHKDITWYKNSTKMRYSFAVEMAETWLNIIKKLSPEKIKELQEFLHEKTFVGE
jgi:hypothetical protein